ncbi:MAG: tRNA pseudouridine(55) synthase TruB [Legionellales bacterium]|nr:tRNA pseudouridine(55) synthase TruB [Legionellales bacterium]
MLNQSDAMMMAAVILLDKPSGLTSRQCVNHFVRMFKQRRVGHGGTLDPLATGMLPICIGEATKFLRFFLESDKSYRVELSLGVQTSTADTAGEIIKTLPVPHYDQNQLERILEQFKGVIQQKVPLVSAVRVQGKRLYEWARSGQSVECPVRTVSIHGIHLIKHSEHSITLDVECAKGTYIRALVEDIGRALGTCAHVKYLHRHWVAPFQDCIMEPLALFDESMDVMKIGAADFKSMYSLDALFLKWPHVVLSPLQKKQLYFGQALSFDACFKSEQQVALYTEDKRFFGVGVYANHRLQSVRLLRA